MAQKEAAAAAAAQRAEAEAGKRAAALEQQVTALQVGGGGVGEWGVGMMPTCTKSRLVLCHAAQCMCAVRCDRLPHSKAANATHNPL